MLRSRTWRAGLYLAFAPLSLLGACGDDSPENSRDGGGAIVTSAVADSGVQVVQPPPAGPGVVGPGAAAGGTAGGVGATPDAGAPKDSGTTGTQGGGAATGGGGMTGGTGVPVPTFVSGPVDGDPSKPVVAVPSVACGGSNGGLGAIGGSFGGFPIPGSPNLKIGGRDVILTYPCNKREGAAVTFILNLHGTMPTEDLKFYQHGYFAAHTLTNSHNLIIATPKSVVSQWGNGDDGKDKPHLYEVINWVYTNFAKFNITGLWVAGHSWGSMFAKTFVCDDMLKDRAKGVIGMSGGATGVGGGGFGGILGGAAGGGGAGCADRLSQIHTVGDAEGSGGVAGLPDQTAAAAKHGCGAKVGPKDVGAMQMLDEWPNCSPGWTHFDFTMGGHEHTTPINPEIVKYIVEHIKATEKKP